MSYLWYSWLSSAFSRFWKVWVSVLVCVLQSCFRDAEFEIAIMPRRTSQSFSRESLAWLPAQPIALRHPRQLRGDKMESDTRAVDSRLAAPYEYEKLGRSTSRISRLNPGTRYAIRSRVKAASEATFSSWGDSVQVRTEDAKVPQVRACPRLLYCSSFGSWRQHCIWIWYSSF